MAHPNQPTPNTAALAQVEKALHHMRSNTRPLGISLSKLISVLVHCELDNSPALQPDDVFNTFEVQITNSHLASLGVSTTSAVSVLLSLVAHSIPHITLLCVYMKYYACHQPITKFTMSHIPEVFPDGFPTANAMDQVWEMQQTKNGNLMDKISNSTTFAIDI